MQNDNLSVRLWKWRTINPIMRVLCHFIWWTALTSPRGSRKMDSDLVLTECFSRRILRFTTSPIDLIHSERVSSSRSSFLAHCLAYASHASMIISKFWCHENETGSLNLGPLRKRSLSLSFCTILRSLYLVLGREGPYFVRGHSNSKSKYTEEDIIRMLKFLVDNIFVVFAWNVFEQIIGIPMGTNCAPLLAVIFLYPYEAEFIQSLLSTGRKRLASLFMFTYRYIDDVLSINSPVFENYLGQIYPPELEIKDTTESKTSASYLDLLLSIGRDSQLHTSLYDKRDDFNFNITNCPFLSRYIPSSPDCDVFITQLIRYAMASSFYESFILRAVRLSLQ